jgi:hypothetical protein
MKNITPLLISLLALAPAGASAQTLLLNYNFNNVTGTSVTDASGDGRTGTLFGVASQGSSTSGLTGVSDNSLNLTSATMAGATVGSGGGVNAGAISSLQSFTLTLWFNKEVNAISGTRLMDDGTSLLAFTNNGNITFNSSGGTAVGNGTSNPALTNNNAWVFVAVTYDGSLASSQIKLYSGTSASSAALIAQGNTSLTGIAFSSNLSFGARYATSDRGFDGSLDNIRLYGEASGGSGALDLAAINAIRTANLTAIPEPATYALAIGALTLTAAVVRRRHKTRAA